MQLYVWLIENISVKKFLCWTIGVNWTHSQLDYSPQLLIPVTKRGTLCTAAANQKHFQAMTILTRPDNAQSTPATLCSLGPVGKVSDEAHRCTTAVDWPIPFQARPNQLSRCWWNTTGLSVAGAWTFTSLNQPSANWTQPPTNCTTTGTVMAARLNTETIGINI